MTIPKIAALTIVTLYSIYLMYNMTRRVLADSSWQSSGDTAQKWGIIVFVFGPIVLVFLSLVYLWTSL